MAIRSISVVFLTSAYNTAKLLVLPYYLFFL